MTKEELIAKMAASAGITKVAAGTALQAFTGAVTTSLKKGQRVSLVNLEPLRSPSGKLGSGEIPEPVRHYGFPRPKFRSFRREKS